MLSWTGRTSITNVDVAVASVSTRGYFEKRINHPVKRAVCLRRSHWLVFTIAALASLFPGSRPALATLTVVSNGVVSSLGTGSSPLGTLSGAVTDLSGNVYVVDTTNSQIIKIAPNGATASDLSITGLSPALSSPLGLAIDSSGNLYIPDTGNSRIVEVSPSGAGSVISTSSITLNAPQGVAVDVSGNIYISDTGNSRIIKVTAGGVASVFTITGLSPVLSNQRGLAVDPSGNLYIADTGNSRVVKVSPAGVAGTPLTTADGTALDAPSGLAVGNNGVLYIADTNTTVNANPTPGRVVIVDSQGNASELLGGSPVFNSPEAIAITPAGGIYVADNGGTSNTGRVQLFQSFTVDPTNSFTSSVGFGHVQLGSAGSSITIPFSVGGATTLSSVSVYTGGAQNLDFTIASGTTCAASTTNTNCTVDVQFSPTAAGLRKGALILAYGSGSLTVPIFGVADAPVAALSPAVASVTNIGSSSLSSPFQTAVDPAGNIYVSNYGANTVSKIPAGGGSATTVSTAPFTLSQPTGVALDNAGNLFIADYGNSRIIEVSSGGTASLFSISGLSQSIDLPTALAFDAAGNLYITDYDIGRMVEVNPYGQGTVLATGTVTFTTTTITGSAVGADGTVYIADRTNDRIVKVNSLGYATLLSFSAVGALSNPEGVAVDPSGNVYVMDSSNQRIIQITTSGATSVMAFSGPTLGSFIFGLTPDANGNLLVADWSNNRLVRINVGQSALTFPSTTSGTSGASKVSIVTNLGDQSLVFSANPSYTANFSLSPSDPNPDPNAACTSSTTLTSGTSCDVPILFTPQSAGSLSANVRSPTIRSTWPTPRRQFRQRHRSNAHRCNPGDHLGSGVGDCDRNELEWSAQRQRHERRRECGGNLCIYGHVARWKPRGGNRCDGARSRQLHAHCDIHANLHDGIHLRIAFGVADRAGFRPECFDSVLVLRNRSRRRDCLLYANDRPATGTTFAGPITFSASGLPTGATATFTPAINRCRRGHHQRHPHDSIGHSGGQPRGNMLLGLALFARGLWDDAVAAREKTPQPVGQARMPHVLAGSGWHGDDGRACRMWIGKAGCAASGPAAELRRHRYGDLGHNSADNNP